MRKLGLCTALALLACDPENDAPADPTDGALPAIEDAAPPAPEDAAVVDAEALGPPCLRTTPEAAAGLDLGDVPLDGHFMKTIGLASCGEAPLTIEAIALTPDSDPAFALPADGLPPLPTTFSADDLERNVHVDCRPASLGAVTGTLEIRSDDPAAPVARWSLICRGVENQCPRPAVAQALFQVEAYEVVLLDASPSTDPDGRGGRPVRYRWDVVSGPAGSSAHAAEALGNNPQQPYEGASPDDESTPTARIFMDVSGTFRVALTVTDNMDLEAPSAACPEPVAEVVIEVAPPAE
jgi:hypothetical protein